VDQDFLGLAPITGLTLTWIPMLFTENAFMISTKSSAIKSISLRHSYYKALNESCTDTMGEKGAVGAN